MKLFIATLLMFIAAFAAFAQTGNDVTPYLFHEFVKASVLQKGGGATEASINYNTLTQEMVYMDGATKMVLGAVETIDTIYIQNKKFIPVGNVFYEKLTDTKYALYEQHFCKILLKGRNADLQDQVNNTITASQGIQNHINTSYSKYDMKFGEGYTMEAHNTFYLQKVKSFYSIDGLKSILKYFPGKEPGINAYIKDKNLDLTQAGDLAKLIVFCNLP
jgi:hypothetical protein